MAHSETVTNSKPPMQIDGSVALPKARQFRVTTFEV